MTLTGTGFRVADTLTVQFASAKATVSATKVLLVLFGVCVSKTIVLKIMLSHA